MTAAPSFNSELRDLYSQEFARIRQEFARTADGRAAVKQRTQLVEELVVRLWEQIIASDSSGPRGFALAAIGGFGRGWLFPHSDIDLLFLHADGETEERHKDAIRDFSRELWDARVRVSPTTRSLAECDRLEMENVEFTISLLDGRYLAGDRELFARLHDKVLPKLVLRESQVLVQALGEISRARHGKFGNTVFHLEPNVKETPGNLRDCNVASWLALISAMDKLRDWPEPGSMFSTPQHRAFRAATEFLFSLRCFLHFCHGRDDNTLTWEAQDEAAEKKIGAQDADVPSTADWMRIYYTHARSIYRTASQLLEEVPGAHSSLYQQFQNWRSRLSNADFSVVDGLVFLRQPAALHDPDLLLRTFEFLAHNGLKLSATTEHRIEQVLPPLAATPPRGAELWSHLQSILTEPHAADALRAMHSLRLLTLLVPELKPIDALVIRDYYHRYTVDEHSMLAIDNLHRLRRTPAEREKGYAEILGELEQPELLFLSLLLHDVGKGTPEANHVQASLVIAEQCMHRLDLEPRDRETVTFLIGNHLEMSAALRRDIFDAATIRALAEKVGTPERLKMLCLMTYADIKAVSPEALTPWKAENLWQLYIATANHLNRSLDQRLHVDSEQQALAAFGSLTPSVTQQLKSFLEGLPRRYLHAYPTDDVLRHLEMMGKLAAAPVQLRLKRGRHWYELTVVTQDRPFLFASLAGTLAAWGMNIVKADAFSNRAGIVVDTFYFTDRFRTLELNPPEGERFQRSVQAVLLGEADLERMLRDRLRSDRNGGSKVKVATQVEFDDQSSSTSTLVQVITQDRLGLLHRISSCLSHQRCNIEIALIDTEGQMAIDVFYLTFDGAKLKRAHQKRLQAALLDELGA